MTTRVKLRSAAAAVALIAATSVAHANDFFPDGSLPSGDFTIAYQESNVFAGTGSENFNVSGNGTTLAGGFSVKTGTGAGTDNFIAWCLDLFDTLANNQFYKV